MKNIAIVVAAFLAMTFASCETKKEKQEAAAVVENRSEDSLRHVIEQKDNEINDMMSTLNEVQEGFRQINEAQGRISVERSQGEGSNRQSIIENMALIQRTMKFNQDLIASLRQQLRTSSVNNSKLKATLEETLNNLTKQMQEKDQQISQLREELAKKDIRISEQDQQISSLNTSVGNLSAANDAKARKVAEQDQQLHTAWYVFGTKKELRQQRILQKGDVLKHGNFNKDYFTKIDIRVDRVIKLYSKSAKLLTSHPAGTYSLDRDAQGQYTLRITNPREFWSVSKYLVISVK